MEGKKRKLREAIAVGPLLSSQQQESVSTIINTIETGGSLHGVKAYAGSGKTTSMIHLLINLNNQSYVTRDQQTLTLVFNKSVKESIEEKLKQAKLPKCRFHVKTYCGFLMSKGLLYNHYPHSKFTYSNNKYGLQISDLPQYELVNIMRDQYSKLLYAIHKTIQNYCISLDYIIGNHHVPSSPFDSDLVVRLAASAWNKYMDPQNKKFVLTMEMSLKLLSIYDIKCPYQYILCDEAQDIPDVLWSWLTRQTHCHIICVGDIYQTINTWVPGVNGAFKNHSKWTTMTELCETRRFGEGIEGAANSLIEFMRRRFHESGYPKRLIPINDKRGNIRMYTNIANTVQKLTKRGGNIAILCRLKASVINVLSELHSLTGISSVKVASKEEVEVTLQLIQDMYWLWLGCHANIQSRYMQSVENCEELLEQHSYNEEYNYIFKFIQRYQDDTMDVIQNIRIILHNTSTVGIPVHICTLHSQKGNEFNHVVIADDYALDTYEDCCIYYTAITRTMGDLWMPRTYMNDVMKYKVNAEYIEQMYIKWKNRGLPRVQVEARPRIKRARIRIPSVKEFEDAEKYNYRIPLDITYE